MSVLRERWPTTPEFLDAVDRYWGRGHRTARDGGVHLAACPACRSKSIEDGWLRWPLVVAATRRLSVFASCGCSERAIAAALLAGQIAALDDALSRLDGAA